MGRRTWHYGGLVSAVCASRQVQAMQAQIAQLSAQISVLQGAVLQMEQETRGGEASAGGKWSAHLTDVKMAK